MDDRRYGQLEGLPVPVFALRDGRPEAANGAARALFPGWRPEDGLPAPLAGLLAGADDLSAGLTGCCAAEGRECRVTLSPAWEGEQLLCVLPREGGTGVSPDVLGEQLRQCLAELHLAAGRLGRPVEALGDPRCDGAFFTLQRGVYRLLRMTRHLELLRQLDEGPAAGEGVLVLRDLCADLSEQAGLLARQAGVELSFESRLLTLPFLGDAALLQTMLLNLLSNAVKAAGKGGAVTVRLDRADGRALLSVEDSGGAGTADLSALFRGAPPRLDPGAGLGIGLTLVRRIALAHGGTVLAAAGGEGTRITVSLPLRETEGRLPLRSPRLDAEGGFSPVLVELADALPPACYDYADLD